MLENDRRRERLLAFFFCGSRDWLAFTADNLIRECMYLKCADLRSDSSEPWISKPLSDAILLGVSENSTSARDFASRMIWVKWEVTVSIAAQSSWL
jgi:hypothetical protein